MRTLFLDLASHSTLSHEGACIACVEGDHTKAIEFIDERIGDDGLMPAVDHILAAAGWEYADLTHIACIVGPGGFTSLRMAVSLANVLADQLKIPVAGIHLSDLYAFRVTRSDSEHATRNAQTRTSETQSFLWLHSTKRVQMFVRGFGELAKQFPETALVEIGKLPVRTGTGGQVTSYKLDDVGWCGELILEHQKIIEEAGMKKMAIQPIAEALPGLLARQSYTSDILLPWYGRGW